MDLDERTTRYVMETLAADVERCAKGIEEAIAAGKKDEKGALVVDYEFHARQLFRAAFAYIEAMTFSVKARAAQRSTWRRRISTMSF
jgi:hypothetical protein